MNVYKNVNIALAISISLSACQGEEKLQRLSINELTLLSQFDIEQQYLKDLKQQYADEEARLIALSETYFLNKIDNQIILVDKESIDSNRVCLSGTISNWGDENVKSLTLRYTVKHQVSRRIIDVFEEEVYNSETDWLQKASNLDVSLRYSDRLTNSLTKGQTSQGTVVCSDHPIFDWQPENIEVSLVELKLNNKYEVSRDYDAEIETIQYEIQHLRDRAVANGQM